MTLDSDMVLHWLWRQSLAEQDPAAARTYRTREGSPTHREQTGRPGSPAIPCGKSAGSCQLSYGRASQLLCFPLWIYTQDSLGEKSGFSPRDGKSLQLQLQAGSSPAHHESKQAAVPPDTPFPHGTEGTAAE